MIETSDLMLQLMLLDSAGVAQFEKVFFPGDAAAADMRSDTSNANSNGCLSIIKYLSGHQCNRLLLKTVVALLNYYFAQEYTVEAHIALRKNISRLLYDYCRADKSFSKCFKKLVHNVIDCLLPEKAALNDALSFGLYKNAL